MFLFIFESIGTSELILVGIIALVLLGPRKLPEIARKAGKIMAEFRGTASEFRQTWEREVDFEEEARSLNLDTIEEEVVARGTMDTAEPTAIPEAPAVRAVDPDEFKHMMPPPADAEPEPAAEVTSQELNEKQNWV